MAAHIPQVSKYNIKKLKIQALHVLNQDLILKNSIPSINIGKFYQNETKGFSDKKILTATTLPILQFQYGKFDGHCELANKNAQQINFGDRSIVVTVVSYNKLKESSSRVPQPAHEDEDGVDDDEEPHDDEEGDDEESDDEEGDDEERKEGVDDRSRAEILDFNRSSSAGDHTGPHDQSTENEKRVCYFIFGKSGVYVMWVLFFFFFLIPLAQRTSSSFKAISTTIHILSIFVFVYMLLSMIWLRDKMKFPRYEDNNFVESIQGHFLIDVFFILVVPLIVYVIVNVIVHVR